MLWVTATDLTLWSEKRISQQELSIIVRRLVLTSCKSISRLQFPGGDSVVLPGWDGILECSDAVFPVPSGTSVWEFGTSKNVVAKADQDFEKRSKSPDGVNPKRSTLVIVSSRRWPSRKISKEKWCQRRQLQGPWKRVQVIDADDLEAWLEQTPSVGAWLAGVHGKPTAGVEALDAFCTRLTSDTQPPLAPNLILAGREDLSQKVSDWAEATDPILRIKADTIDEAILLVAASSKQEGGAAEAILFANTLVVYDADTWRKLSAHVRPLILIPVFRNDALGLAEVTGRGHWIIVPSDWAANENQGMLVAPWLDREKLYRALTPLVGEIDARRHSDSCGRSLQVLTRRLAITPERRAPSWSYGSDATALAPALLAGRWNAARDGDCEVLSELAGEPYQQWESKLVRLLNVPDAPIRRIGDVFVLTSPIDAWLLLGRHVHRAVWVRYSDLLLKLLLERDPKLDLDVDKRWFASLYGKERRQSSLLRKGLVEQLARMLGAEDQLKLDINPDVAQVAKRIVLTALTPATDLERWASIGSVLPTLAEMAPEILLDRLDQLTADEALSRSIFENVDALFGTSLHVYVMWALQRTRWFKGALYQCGLILVRLHSRDPGGNSSPRPRSVFVETFCPERPNNLVGYEDQIAIVTRYLNEMNSPAWDLVFSLLDSRNSFQIVDRGPTFRQLDGTPDFPLTWGEYRKRTDTLLSLLIEFAHDRIERWCKLAGQIDDMQGQSRETLIRAVRQFATKQKKVGADSTAVYQKLMDLVRRHEAFADCDWAMSESWLKKIRAVASLLKPNSAVETHKWLFSQQVPDKYLQQYEKNKNALSIARSEAVAKIFQSEGIQGLNALKITTDFPGLVGDAIAGSNLSEKSKLAIFSHFVASTDGADEALVRCYVARLFERRGIVLSEFVLRYGNGLNELEFGRFAQGLPAGPAVWDIVERRGQAAEQHYWGGVSWFISKNAIDIVRASRNLIKFGRYYQAINTVGLTDATLPADLVIDAIRTVPRILEDITDPLAINNFRYDIARLFKKLRKTDVDGKTLIALEFEYFPLLENAGYDFPSIQRELSSNPSFFVELLKVHYKRSDGKEDEGSSWKSSPNREAIAHRVFNILHDFSAIPGLDGKDPKDRVRMTDWISEVFSQAAAVARRGVAETRVGDALARAPIVPDETWPAEHVCDAIESYWSENLASGFNCGAHNKLGARWVGEGQADAALAAQYQTWASARELTHPRTATLLRELAESFRRQSVRHRQDSELNRQIE